MGQPHGKDAGAKGATAKRPVGVSRPAGAGGGSSAAQGTGAMRPQTVNDALLQNSSHATRDQTGNVQLLSGAAGAGGLSSNQQPTSATSAQGGKAPQLPPQPVVIRYKNTDVKLLLSQKAQIDLLLFHAPPQPQAMGEWRRIPMSRSEDNYFAIVELPPGSHNFRFLIGEQTKVDVSQPTTSPQPSEGAAEAPCNVIQVSGDLMNTKDDDDLIDDGTGWGQVETAFDETRKYPPMLPPHLRYTPLNTPPTQVRCMNNGNLNVTTPSTLLEPEHLPLPLSVTINHVYFQKREDHVVSGMTTRYCNKFTTIAYYQGIQPPQRSNLNAVHAVA